MSFHSHNGILLQQHMEIVSGKYTFAYEFINGLLSIHCMNNETINTYNKTYHISISTKTSGGIEFYQLVEICKTAFETKQITVICEENTKILLELTVDNRLVVGLERDVTNERKLDVFCESIKECVAEIKLLKAENVMLVSRVSELENDVLELMRDLSKING